MSEKTDLGTAVRALAASRRRSAEEAPSADRLIDYQAGLLADDEAQQVEAYLAYHPEAAALLLDVAALPEGRAAEVEGVLSSAEAAADWQRLQARLGSTGGRDAEPGDREAAALRAAAAVPMPPSASRALPWSLAAVFFATTIAAGVWVSLQQAAIDALSQPRANVVLHDLQPEQTGTRRGGPPPPPSTVPGGGTGYVLILNLIERRTYERYRAELRDAAEHVVWQADQLVRHAYGFSLVVPRGYLDPGRYRIHLFGHHAQTESELATYRVEVDPP